MTKRAIIVLRRSTSNQDVSLQAQQADCERAAAENGWKVAGVFSDTASGSADLDARPGLMEALNNLRKGDVLIARSASRISRKIGIHLAIEDQVAAKRAQIYYCDNGHVDSNPEKVLLRRIRDSISEYELALVSFRTKSAMAKLRTDGRALGSPAMTRFGFSRSEDGKTLVENPAEMACVRRIWELKTAGASGIQIKAALDLEGFTTRKGKPIHQTGIYRLMKSIFANPELYSFIQKAESKSDEK
jgi:DNA invertase Pin-like site-specific DNA recombinase